MRNPFLKYELGILNSSYTESQTDHSNRALDSEINPLPEEIKAEEIDGDRSTLYEDVQNLENIRQEVDTDLNFKIGACSLGISFVLKGKTPRFRTCLTWGRYDLAESSDGKPHLWKRHPNFFITGWIDMKCKNETFELKNDVDGSVVTHPGVFLHVFKTKVAETDNWAIRLFLENKTQYDTSSRQKEKDRVFQPQIRVIVDESEVVDLDQSNQENDQGDLLYNEQRTKARGYLCSAVWKEVDPETDLSGGIGTMSWPDSEVVPQKTRMKFTNPDVRSEYIPLYAILQPNPDSPNESFDAGRMSQEWDPKSIERELGAIVEEYSKWIQSQTRSLEQKKTSGCISEQLHRQGTDNLKLCTYANERIRRGIDFLKSSEKARAAFCFMNAVMNDKRLNEESENLSWRKFQMAFILHSIRGVSGDSKEDRECADVLWFPTGGGKTEAYLGIVIFAIAYRRLQHGDKLNNDGGVTVISRYTLRLLTIQQFQRALGAIVAADLRRVENWIPDASVGKISDPDMKRNLEEGSVWGMQRFSIGLWIGNSITPKDFAQRTVSHGKIILNAEGALRSNQSYNKQIQNNENGNPAQVQNCPVCKNILCVPREQKMGRSQPITLTWVIKLPNTLSELENIEKKQFESSRIAIHDDPHFDVIRESSDGMQYYRMTMTIQSKSNRSLSRNEIDVWWRSTVQGNLDAGRGDILQSTSPSMPGYFFLYNPELVKPHDFIIFCTSRKCKLNKTDWSEKIEGVHDTNVPEYFQKIGSPPSISTSVPISAYVTDEQIYSKCPSFLISTVDKFANMPFVPKCASIFGNVDVVHPIYGYGRRMTFEAPLFERNGKRICVENELQKAKGFNPPSLILQDELHLIEGPLGSMVGAYEMAVDILCNVEMRPKYIASSATIKEADTQVGTVFRRDLATFPPRGINSSDNYFSKIDEDVTCVNNKPGRLYLGIASSKSTVTLPIKTQSIIMSEVYKIRNNPHMYGLEGVQGGLEDEISAYWTFVSYFTDLQLLSKFTNYYKEDITRNVGDWSVTKISNGMLNPSTTVLDAGLHRFQMILEEDMDVSGVSVYCANNRGSMRIALYKVDSSTNKLLWSSGSDKCRLGRNRFLVPKSNEMNLKRGDTVWLVIANTSNETVFEASTAQGLDGMAYQGYDPDPFPDVLAGTNTSKEKAIRFAINSASRTLMDENGIQLSSETESDDLGKYLERLNEKFGIDSLQTSPVFGTGIDIDRLGMMQIMNQPKTNSGYIQSSGRVGRTIPGLVINWLRAGRARDLSHYENFIGYHRMLHRFVEPVTASPFSDEVMELCLGPMLVAILRNARIVGGTPINQDWVVDGAHRMVDHMEGPEIAAIEKALEEIASSEFIAEFRKMSDEKFKQILGEAKAAWYEVAKNLRDHASPFEYDERRPDRNPQCNVVLGTANHELMGHDVVYKNTPNSLRKTESMSVFHRSYDKVQIRPSQFITRYGPGSLISGKSVTWAVPSLTSMVNCLHSGKGNFEHRNNDGKAGLFKYEIQDSRMKRILHKFYPRTDFDDLRLFTLPSNSSLMLRELDPLYKCHEISKWVICYSNLHAHTRILTTISENDAVMCPECKKRSAVDDPLSTKFFSTRYMLACKNGHMGDVDWKFEVHRENRSECNGNIFEWRTSDSDDNVEITCLGYWDKNSFVHSHCNAGVTYFELKRRSNNGELSCPTTFIEQPFGNTSGCAENGRSLAKMISKSQMSIRLPVIVTTMEIEPKHSSLFEQYNNIAGEINTAEYFLNKDGKELTKNEMTKYLEDKKDDIKGVTNSLIRQTKAISESEFLEIVGKVKAHGDKHKHIGDLSEYEALEEELSSLEAHTQDAGRGAKIRPDDPHTDIRFPIQFKVNGIHFQAMPFPEIGVTQVQLGYTREVPPPIIREMPDETEHSDMHRIGEIVSLPETHQDRHGSRWQLANRLQGEGIFIHLDPEHHENGIDIFKNANPETFALWNNIHGETVKRNTAVKENLKKQKSKTKNLDFLDAENTRTNPIFVWWHSFVHEFINQLAIDSGFMGVSLGERVYCVKKQSRYASGIFVYVSSPGADGTLGGLTSLVDDGILPKIVEKTLNSIQNCSNDPICSGMKINRNKRTGAACHICLMNSETSCAYQNKFLDRNIIREMI